MIDAELKKYIKNNIDKKPFSEILDYTGLEKQEVLNYLQKIWKAEKFQKLIANHSDVKEIEEVNIKSLFKEYKYFLLCIVGLITLIR